MVPDGGLDAITHKKMGQYFTDQVVAIYKDMKENSCPVGQSRIFIAKFNREENDPHFVISTTGPIYTEAEKDHAAFQLQSCYITSLTLANLYQLSSIAYPAISCGAYHFPPHEAAQVAIESVRQYAFNVRKVSFVLFDRSTYEVFVEEWKTYAMKINKNANSSDQTGNYISETSKKFEASSTGLSATLNHYCVLCKTKEMPINQQLVCLNCSKLTRSELFRNFLMKLRIAGEKSYDELVQECQTLKPILKLHTFVYNPVKVFNQAIHRRDFVSENYLQQHCDKKFRNKFPMAIVGDGNCFYNAFVELGGFNFIADQSSLTPIELRARNVVELVLNRDLYTSQYERLLPILDPFEDYVSKEMVRDTNYAAVWDLLSIPTVLNINLISVYPRVNGPTDLHYQHINSSLFVPLEEVSDEIDDKTETESKSSVECAQVMLLFSHTCRPTIGNCQGTTNWLSNHFVPLLDLR